MKNYFEIKTFKRDLKTSHVSNDAHLHDFHEIFYLKSGECTAFIGHSINKYKKGDFVIVPAGLMHRTDYTGIGLHERVVISFSEDIVSWLKEALGKEMTREFLNSSVVSVPEKRREYVEEILSKLFFEKTSPDILSEGYIKCQMTQLLLFILRCKKYGATIEREPEAKDSIIQEAAEYIYNNYSEKITLEDMAERLHMSTTGLSKKFKSATGFGFKEYLQNIRITNAERLLIETDKPVTEIAYECGFSDSNYFGDAFKKIKGTSPLKYRKIKEAL